MIVDHTELPVPPDSTVLWRFLDFTKFVSLLDSSSLYFTRSSKMEDKYEGCPPKLDMEASLAIVEKHPVPEGIKEQMRANVKAGWREIREKFFISCWHANEHESAAMWKLYLKSDEGVAVRTTLGDVRRAFAATPETVFPTAVTYLDYTKDSIPGLNLFCLMAHKRRSFEHEKEVRLIWWAMLSEKHHKDEEAFRAHLQADHGPGKALQIATADLIQEVYVSPTAQAWFRDLVESVTRRYNLKCPVLKSNLYDDPVW